mmetsp:Transcript_10656/g.15897  ORF Transcript_10656/g.15897 Transcript_10656/m.15897 type:complete len:132 (+) Transcript_10656:754-1149(+)
MIRTSSFSFYSEGIGASGTEGWKLFLMMVFGSFVAGATSEGGGSVAFPVMTLVLGIAPDIARDFSLMIQSIGMTAAMFGIFYSRIAIDWLAFKFATESSSDFNLLHQTSPEMSQRCFLSLYSLRSQYICSF